MPIYEFRCQACGASFEGLVSAGTETTACSECGSERTERVYSAQAAPFHLVKTPAETRKQERSNAQLRKRAKDRFMAARRRAPESGGSGGGAR
jgi:putative FmdB family regulatory protein